MTRKRRNYADKFKGKVALEAVKGVRTMSELSSAFGVHAAVISRWKQQLIDEVAVVFAEGNGGSRKRTEEEVTGPLYAEIGRLKMEVDWFKKKL